ncbi:hypothetical protein Csa_004867 [Cucumis sativus]|nr:hypothetical protein Csa_004867 [Cucumis sativus]
MFIFFIGGEKARRVNSLLKLSLMDSILMQLSQPLSLRSTLLNAVRTPPSISSISLGENLHFQRRHFNLDSTKNGGTDTQRDPPFDEPAFEAERSRLDAQARKSMAEASIRDTEGASDDDPKAWKWVIRKRIWDFMESQNVATDTCPVHHCIPDFIGATEAANRVSSPYPGGKKLLTSLPRLRTRFFSIVESGMLTPATIRKSCPSLGVAKYGKPIGLDEKIKVDLIVIGSVAVDPKTGAQLGKGEGFAELEYGMLRYMGAIDDSTLIVTSGCVILTNTKIPKPQGIYWEMLSPEKLSQIRILRELKRRIERETGKLLPCGPSEKLPPTAQRTSKPGKRALSKK